MCKESTTDPRELQAYYQELSDEALAQLHSAGPGAYVPEAWAILDDEFRTRAAGPATVDEEMHLVTVFVGSTVAALAVAKLALQSGGIPFIAKGEWVQDVIGLGRVFGGMNLATGPVQLQVRSEDSEYARDLLSDLTN